MYERCWYLSFVFDYVPGQFKTQEMCDKAISNDPFMLKYCLDICTTSDI